MNRYLILTSGRSGSNYLANLCNLHPHLVNYGEVLSNQTLPYRTFSKCNKLCRLSTRSYLNLIYHSKTIFYLGQLYSAYAHKKNREPIQFKRWNTVKSIGTKDFFLNYRKKQVEDFIIDDKEMAIIHLYRENNLRRYISAQFMAQKINRAFVKSEQKPAKQITIDINHMLEKLAEMDRENEHKNKMMTQLKTDHRVLTIRYEDHFAHEASIIDHNKRIFEFLGVEPLELISQHKKILPTAIPDLVNNYDELAQVLTGSQYEHYLN